MARKILVCVAWPYANNDLHLGHLAGAYLPADIFARYHRLAGNDVLMVSGSDSHGTPITVAADRKGISPRELFEYYHHRFLETQQRIGISYDLFTHTDTANHYRVAQDIFLKLLEKGYLYRATQPQFFSTTTGRALPDRYVEGTCPHCGYPEARGDQCDNCGRLLDALELINPRSKLDGSTPVVRESEHFFLNLPLLQDRIAAFLAEGKDHWRPNVLNFSRNYVAAGLQGRPITRDIEWGIPVPLPGYEEKRLYVWFEAVIGYLSASIEWSRNVGRPDAWKEWWYNPEARTYYFIGKDNIPFHTIIWPAMLIGVERLYEDDPDRRLNLPYDVPANEFLNLEGAKFSKSHGRAIWLPEYLDQYAPDPLRYYVTAIMPETADTNFSWAEFVRRNNDELLATWGNLCHRVLTFAHRNFEGCVPVPGLMDRTDVGLLAKIDVAFGPIGQLLEGCHFRTALSEVMALAREVNRYLEEKGPWFQIKEDRAAAGTTIYVALRAIDSLKVLFAPFLPFSSEALHQYLGYEGTLFGRQYVATFHENGRSHDALCYDPSGATGRWKPSELPAGQPLRPPQPLYAKLSPVEETLSETGRG
ncbi:MAG: methionine--tRNA ligase [Thermoflexia bacterium]|nr:MAG: methionine--tRNA ligase [Thermoflexia bacterium]